jgi:hypothetical protein
MNVASAKGHARQLRDWLVESDADFDPQANDPLRPDVVVQLAAEMVGETTPYVRERRAAESALGALRRTVDEGPWLCPALSRPPSSS